MGTPGSHIARDMGTEGSQISGVIVTGSREPLGIWGSFGDVGTPTFYALCYLITALNLQ